MTVTVSEAPDPQGTVAVATGLDEQGRTVTFAGDWRAMQGLAELVEEQGEVDCYVEGWQVLSVGPPEVH